MMLRRNYIPVKCLKFWMRPEQETRNPHTTRLVIKSDLESKSKSVIFALDFFLDLAMANCEYDIRVNGCELYVQL